MKVIYTKYHINGTLLEEYDKPGCTICGKYSLILYSVVNVLVVVITGDSDSTTCMV